MSHTISAKPDRSQTQLSRINLLKLSIKQLSTPYKLLEHKSLQVMLLVLDSQLIEDQAKR